AADQPISLAPFGNAGTAAVRRTAGRLAEEQALVRRGGRNAAAAALFDDRVVIVALIEAEERQLKAVLATLFAVAAAGVAPVATQERHDLAAEIDGPSAANALYLDGNDDLLALVGNDDLRRTFRHRCYVARGIDGGDRLVLASVGG